MNPNPNERLYRFEGRFTQIIPVGPTADGLRMDSHFGGTIVSGELAGATVTGVDYFRVRADGVGVVDGHEVVEHEGRTIAVRIRGLIVPPAGLPAPSPEQLADPNFSFPDVDFGIQVFATFETAAPELAHLNRTTVVHLGTVNMNTLELIIDAYPLARRPVGAAA